MSKTKQKNGYRYRLVIWFKDGNERTFWSREKLRASEEEIRRAYNKLVKCGNKYIDDGRVKNAIIYDANRNEVERL